MSMGNFFIMSSLTASIPTHLLVLIFLLSTHILCGFISLGAALGAMLTAKGKSKHRRFGQVFIGAMTGVFITAVPLTFMFQSLFIFFIAIFSYYFAYSGWRYAKPSFGAPKVIDWIVSMIMLTSSLIMSAFGISHYHLNEYALYIMLILGTVGFISSINILKVRTKKPSIEKERIIKHFTHMIGATIAAVTAFCVTTLSVQPHIVLWIAPTLFIAPLILWWKKRIMRQP